VREKALALLERYAEETDPERYHRAGWEVLRQPHLNACQYDLALRQARTACALAPGQARYQTALGVALYRAGDGKEARARLARLRKVLGDPRRSQDRAAHDFLREAEALLGPGQP
jgi:Flp pilus assembly protein TadD